MLIMKKANCVEKHSIIKAEYTTNDKQLLIVLVSVNKWT